MTELELLESIRDTLRFIAGMLCVITMCVGGIWNAVFPK